MHHDLDRPALTLSLPPAGVDVGLACLDDALRLAGEFVDVCSREWVVALVDHDGLLRALASLDPFDDLAGGPGVLLRWLPHLVDVVAAASSVVSVVVFGRHPGAGSAVPEDHLALWRVLRGGVLPVRDLVVIGADHLFSTAVLAGEADPDWE